MKKRRSAAGILFLLLAGRLCAQVSYLPDDPAVRQLGQLYSLAGRVFPTASYPLSKRDLFRFGGELLDSTEEPRLVERISAYLEDLEYDEQVVKISAGGGFTYEYVYRTREEWDDYYRLFVAQAPLISMDLSCVQDDRAAIHVLALWKKQYEGFSNDNFPKSYATNPMAMENQILHAGYFRYFFDPLELELGRNAVHYGAGRFSSLLPSQRLPYLDALRYRLRLGPVEMSSFIATLENREAVEDVIPEDGYDFGTNTILSSLHRFEYRGRRVRAGLSGLSYIVRKENAFQLADVFPVFSWHAATVGEHNLSVVLDLSVVPFPGLELYGQYGVDEVNLTGMGINDRGAPTIDAYILGAEYTRLAGEGYFGATLEAGYTHYLWGSFRVNLDRAILRVAMDGDNQILPMTSPFGPGVIWLYSEGRLSFPGGMEISGFARIINQNSRANLTDTLYEASSEVENAARIVTFSAGGGLTYPLRGSLHVYARPAVHCRQGNWWLELTLGCGAGGAFSAWSAP